MGNPERTDKFNKAASVKAVGETSFSTKNLENWRHAKNFSDYNRSKYKFYNKKAVQNGIETEKSFAEQGSARNTGRAGKESSKEMTPNPPKGSSGCQPVQGKRNETDSHIKIYENKIFTQNMERFKSSERRAVQNTSQQSKTLDQKPAFRVQSKCINSNRTENKTDSAYKNSKSYSSVVSENVHRNDKHVESTVPDKLDVGIAKENSRESRGKQSEDSILSTAVPSKHSLESNATNCLLKNKGAITKTSRCTQTEDKTSSFVTNIKEQNIHKTKESELKQKKKGTLQSDLLNLEKEVVCTENCNKILKDDSTSQRHFHGYLQETTSNSNKCNKIKDTVANTKKCNKIEETIPYLEIQISKEANATNKEEKNDKVEDASELQNAACGPQLQDQTTEKNPEYELQYGRYNNGYLLYRPVAIYPLHQPVPNSAFGQYFGGYSHHGIPYQHFYSGELFNESHRNEFPNGMNYYMEQYNKTFPDNKGQESEKYSLHPSVPDSAFEQPFGEYLDFVAPYQHLFTGEMLNETHSSELPNDGNYFQEQCNKILPDDNKQDLESEKNDSQNSNGSIYQSANLNYAYSAPFLIPWYENGMIYYPYYPDNSPV